MNRSGSRLFIGAILVLIGIGWLLESAGLIDVPGRTVLPLVLVAIGVALGVRSFSGTGGGLVIAGIVISLVLAGSSNRDWNMNFGDGSSSTASSHVYRVLTASDLRDFRLGTGTLTIDLRQMKMAKKTYHVDAHVGAGKAIIIVSRTVPVRVDAHVGVGSISIFGNRRSQGMGNNDSYESPTYAQHKTRFDIDAHVGAGSVIVQRRSK